eukprot:6171723-Pyramimonas_sp.AAC.1
MTHELLSTTPGFAPTGANGIPTSPCIVQACQTSQHHLEDTSRIVRRITSWWAAPTAVDELVQREADARRLLADLVERHRHLVGATWREPFTDDDIIKPDGNSASAALASNGCGATDGVGDTTGSVSAEVTE